MVSGGRLGSRLWRVCARGLLPHASGVHLGSATTARDARRDVMMKRWLIVLGVLLVAGVTWAAVTATPVFVQTPREKTSEIVPNVNPSCTGNGQPYACCTAANTGATCTTLAASTDALPVWQTVCTGGSTGPGSKITGIWIVSTDAVTHTVTCVVNN